MLLELVSQIKFYGVLEFSDKSDATQDFVKPLKSSLSILVYVWLYEVIGLDGGVQSVLRRSPWLLRLTWLLRMCIIS